MPVAVNRDAQSRCQQAHHLAAGRASQIDTIDRYIYTRKQGVTKGLFDFLSHQDQFVPALAKSGDSLPASRGVR